MAPNPASITLPAQSQISISANCNASYTQVLDVTIGDVTERFQGTGENQPMTFGNNQQTWKLPAQAAEQTCLATFYFKTPGSGDLQLARVQDTITKVDDPFTMFFVTSEDSADNDNNDTYLTIFCYDTSPPSLKAGIRGSKGHTARCETEEAMVKQATTYLNTHAKTYYDIPGFQGGDETYVDIDVTNIPASNNAPLPATARGTFGLYKTDVRSDVVSSPFVKYIYVAVTAYDSVHEELAGAYMVLTCYFWYYIYPPSGSQTADWNAEMYNSQYKVIRVTP